MIRELTSPILKDITLMNDKGINLSHPKRYNIDK